MDRNNRKHKQTDFFDKFAWQFKNESEFEEEIDGECLDKDEIEIIHFKEDYYP